MIEEIKATDIANAEIRNIFDDIKFEFRVREGLGDAFDMGDMCMHWFWNTDENSLKGEKYAMYEGKIEAELVDGPNVMFGNPNNNKVSKQPYIIIVGRELASVLKEEAKDYKNKNEIEQDDEWLYQAGDNGKIELNTDKYGKALYIIKYWKDKKTKTIKATKCVRNAYIYKDVDTGLSVYPVAFMNYSRSKNNYHGKAGVTGLIPNQIAINKLLAMIIYNAMKTAFPTMVYNAERMSAPTNEVGKAIPLSNMQPGESIREVAGYLEIGQVANYIITLINLIIDQTKDMLGINDTAVGNVRPDNTSALALAEKLTSVPLENTRSNLYEFTEQCVDIILDMIGTHYGIRPVKVSKGDEKRIVEYDFSKFKNLNSSKRIDVGAIGYASELTSLKELKDLLQTGQITVIDYLERLPEYTIPKTQELVQELKARLGLVSSEEQKKKNLTYEQMAAFMETLPIEQQNELKKLPDNQLEQAIQQLMEQQPQQEQISNENQAILQLII